MGRFRDSANEDNSEASIDMSPLIDCVFILLIFFIVTTVFVEETGVDVDKPQAASASNLEKTSILIAITESGSVIYGGKEIGISGVQPLVRRMVLKEQIPVILQTDRGAKMEVFAQVLDQAKLGGAQVVNLATSRTQG